MKIIEATESSFGKSNAEFLLFCNCSCSIIRVIPLLTDRSVFLIHYGQENPKIKVAQDFELSSSQLHSLITALNSHSAITFTAKRSSKYLYEGLSFNPIEDFYEEGLEISFHVATKRRKLVGWEILLCGSQVEEFQAALQEAYDTLVADVLETNIVG